MTQPQDPTQQPEPEAQDEDWIGLTEVAFAALVLAALNRWLRRVRQAVLGPVERFGVTPDVDEVLFLADGWVSEVDQLLMPKLGQIQRHGWEDTFPDVTFRSGSQFMSDSLSTARNLLVRIPDEVYARISAELQTSANLGEDVYDQARRVDQVLSETGSENWPNRAKVIAVTEVNRAYQAGSLASAFQAQAIEAIPLFKRWDSTRDARVRPAHREAHGQTRALADPFDVGQSRLMYPGDPTGAPHDVIHCRCTMLIMERGR